MFLESEYRFERLERNKGNIKTEEEKIKYMEEEIEILKDLVIKLEKEIDSTSQDAIELKHKPSPCYGCKYSNY